MTKSFLLAAVLFVCCMFSHAYSQTTVPGGFVSGTWTQAGSPYLVTGSVQIPDGTTLEIEPGVDVIFQGAYKILVMGRLLAVGTATDSIRFTAADTSIGWRGIRFNGTPETNDSSILEYCRIIKSKAVNPSEENGGGIYANDVYKLRISHCLITQCYANMSGGGIWCGSTTGNPHTGPFIFDNTIEDNTCNPGGVCYNEGGGGIFANYLATPVISGNQIINNKALGYCAFGGGIMAQNYISIEDNLISGNYSQANGGGMRLVSNGKVKNNVVSYNTCIGYGGGIAVDNGYYKGNLISNNSALGGGGVYFSNPMISHNFTDNVFCNNSAVEGGAIYAYNAADLTVLNSTLVNNQAEKGGAVFAKDDSDVSLINCIVYGNTASVAGNQIFLFDDASDPDILYSNLEGGSAGIDANGNFYTGIFQNNISVDPQFVSPSSGAGNTYDGVTADWSLQSTSPCIDAGDPAFINMSATDIAGNPRVTVCRIDMGAYEYQSGTPFQAYLHMQHPVSCYGYSDAVLQAVASGDTAPYSYLWSTGDTTAVTDSLPVGFYSVTISNAAGCQRVDTITLTQPDGMYFTPYATQGSCSGVCDGSVNVHVWWGGTPPYTYLWNTSPPETTAVTSYTLCPGYYSVTITDSLGCQDTTGILLTQPSNFSVTANVGEITCNGLNNGTIYLNASGGTGTTYQYTINGGAMWTYTNTFSNLFPGTYQIIAKDMAGCMTQPQEIVLEEPPLLETTISVSEASCYNGNNGGVEVTASGGTPTYNFTWNVPGQPSNFSDTSTISATGVPVGNYTVTVTDSRGCSLTLPFSVGISLDSPYVCIVTVDTLSWKNAVIWEKPVTGGITVFNIYKEVTVNNYSQIGSVPYSSSPRFIDNASVPESHGDKYKITAVDTCGNESPLSPFHKTMNLTIAAFGSTMGLNWDDYVDESGGFVPPTYYIYRGYTPASMALHDSVSGSFNSYNDLNVYSLFYYMVGVKKLSGCGGAKATVISFSNKKDNSGMGIGDNQMLPGTIIIVPNPMSSSATLTIPNSKFELRNSNFELRISDLTGKVVRVESPLSILRLAQDDKGVVIERGDLKPGVYFVELNAERVYRGKLVVE